MALAADGSSFYVVAPYVVAPGGGLTTHLTIRLLYGPADIAKL